MKPITSQAEFTLGNHSEQSSTLNIGSKDFRQSLNEYLTNLMMKGGNTNVAGGIGSSDLQGIKSTQYLLSSEAKVQLAEAQSIRNTPKTTTQTSISCLTEHIIVRMPQMSKHSMVKWCH